MKKAYLILGLVLCASVAVAGGFFGTGIAGPQGATGPQGPQGASGSITDLLAFAYANTVTNWGVFYPSACVVTQVYAQSSAGSFTSTFFYKPLASAWGASVSLGTVAVTATGTATPEYWAIPANSVIGHISNGTNQDACLTLTIIRN